ncbi:MAG: serine hydrolase [Acutalibacteraceae bacterium]
MKKIMSLLLAVVFLFLPLCPIYAGAAFDSLMKETLYSKIYILSNIDNGVAVLSKNAGEKSQCPPLNKIMTVAVALKKSEDIDKKIKITQKMLDAAPTRYSVNINLKAGEKISMRSLLYAAMVQGANDACAAISVAVSGSVESFMKEVNSYISSLGCKNTNLVNPTGFDAEGQYTTASDIAKIMADVVKIPLFPDIFSTRSYKLAETNMSSQRSLISTNKMLFYTVPDYYYSYTTGGRAGATDAAGYCMISTASKDGYTYVAVAMQGSIRDVVRYKNKYSEKNTALFDCKTMFMWAFSNIRFKVVATTAQVVSVVDIVAGKESDHVSLVPANEVSSLVPYLADADGVLIEPIEDTLPKEVYAPVKKGEKICEARILYAGEEIGRVDLVAAEHIGLSVPRLIAEKIKDVLTSKIFIAVVIILVALIAIYIIFVVFDNMKSKKNKIHIVGR